MHTQTGVKDTLTHTDTSGETHSADTVVLDLSLRTLRT